MPPLVTTNATILCPHGGRVALTPRQGSVLVQGGPVLCEPDLVGAPIIGCAQPVTPSSKPCTLVAVVNPGSSSLRVTVGGRPAHLATLTGITDGVPPGVITVVNPGQAAVQGLA